MAVTIKDVASKAGVSIFTVSKYMNGGKLKEKNRLQVESAVKTLGYRPNAIAQSLRTSYSRTVGVLVPSLRNQYTADIVVSIEQTLNQFGYAPVVCDFRQNHQLEQERFDFLLSRGVDGLIAMPLSVNSGYLARARTKNVPLVVLDQIPQEVECDCVVVDNHQGVYKAVLELVRIGHRRIAFLGGAQDHYTAAERLNGYKDALTESHIPISEEYVKNGDYTVEGGFRCMMELWDEGQRPTALFVANYEMMLGVLLAVSKRRIFVPDELSVICFDRMELGEIVQPSIAAVVQPIERMGDYAAKLLLRRIGGEMDGFPRAAVLPTELKMADSVSTKLMPEFPMMRGHRTP